MSYIGNIPTTAAFVTDTFSANGSGTVFTLSTAPANTSSILVAVSGVLQDPSTYSVAATTLTFSAAPPAGTGNISVRFLGIPASGVTTTAYRTVTEFTATAGQTTFTPPSYTAGFINVYRNGVMLGSADYTATSGTTVVLATAATAGDLITTESFYVSSVVGAIPATSGAVTSAYLLDGSVTQAKLATGVGQTGPAFAAWLYNGGSNQSVSTTTWTKAIIDTEEFDTANCFNTSTYRFTPNVAGYYFIQGCIYISYNTTGSTRIINAIYKNGAEWKKTQATVTSGYFYGSTPVSNVIYLNGTTDYVELYGYVQDGSGAVFVSGQNGSYFSGSMVRAA